MVTLNENLHAGAFLVQEMPGYFSRDALTVALSQTILAGMVCGRAGVPGNIVSSAAAAPTNTVGSGALTLDGVAPVAANAKNGKYSIVCIEPATNGGIFEVQDPEGAVLGTVAVGATFNNQVKFVIADATDFVAGDRFEITVIREDGADEEVKALNLAGADGSEIASVIAVYPVTTDASNKKKATFITRQAEVRASDLTWPAGITANQKAAAIEQLRRVGIILR